MVSNTILSDFCLLLLLVGKKCFSEAKINYPLRTLPMIWSSEAEFTRHTISFEITKSRHSKK